MAAKLPRQEAREFEASVGDLFSKHPKIRAGGDGLVENVSVQV